MLSFFSVRVGAADLCLKDEMASCPPSPDILWPSSIVNRLWLFYSHYSQFYGSPFQSDDDFKVRVYVLGSFRHVQ